jgi:predicted lipoprotein with Yx(FWY)xxD motif
MNTLRIAMLAAALVAGCGGGQARPQASSTTMSKPAPATTMTKPPATGTRITLGASDFGRILFDGRGQAIYAFGKETGSTPRCYGECAELWPPVYTKGEPRAGGEIRASLLGTTRRHDGRLQVTYGGHPLYFYAHEGRREVKCHNVFLNGGLWQVVGANGRTLK